MISQVNRDGECNTTHTHTHRERERERERAQGNNGTLSSTSIHSVMFSGGTEGGNRKGKKIGESAKKVEEEEKREGRGGKKKSIVWFE